MHKPQCLVFTFLFLHCMRREALELLAGIFLYFWQSQAVCCFIFLTLAGLNTHQTRHETHRNSLRWLRHVFSMTSDVAFNLLKRHFKWCPGYEHCCTWIGVYERDIFFPFLETKDFFLFSWQLLAYGWSPTGAQVLPSFFNTTTLTIPRPLTPRSEH